MVTIHTFSEIQFTGMGSLIDASSRTQKQKEKQKQQKINSICLEKHAQFGQIFSFLERHTYNIVLNAFINFCI